MSRSSEQDCNAPGGGVKHLRADLCTIEDCRTVAVVGSRPPKKGAPKGAWDRWAELERACIAFVNSLPPGTLVVSGGALGLDQLAERTARKQGLVVRSYRPQQAPNSPIWRVVIRSGPGGGGHQEWLPYVFGSFAQAALWRNGEMVRVADGVKVFWDGASRGTADTIRKARAAGKLLP